LRNGAHAFMPNAYGDATERILDPGTEGLAMARQASVSRGRVRLWLRRAFFVACLLVMLPVALTLLYLPAFVHPVSTLMLKDLATFSGYDRRWVPLEDIAPVLAHSVIMSEDGVEGPRDFFRLRPALGAA
jgi:monofunctional biosynthetic peptidoglycan transglycosylase